MDFLGFSVYSEHLNEYLMILSSDIRSRYLAFFQSKGHAIVPSSPLLPENDPTTLFT